MTDGDNPNMRDGTDQDSAGGDGNDPTEEAGGAGGRGYDQRPSRGFHQVVVGFKLQMP